MSGPEAFRDIAQCVRESGLLARGGFHPGPDDGVPGAPGTLLLVGNAGGGMWAAFSKERDAYALAENPLDDWVRDRLGAVAQKLGARTVFPFGGPPYHPFQQWAQRAEPVYPSPLGVLIHPEFGLWHAYRGALLFDDVIDLPSAPQPPSPCDSCEGKPCLSTCPVEAFRGDGYDVPSCVAHIETEAGADCLGHGCRARRACPVGQDYAYAPVQAEHHMKAFRSAQRKTD